ncbi:MAG: Bcep22 5, partial [Alphaproteobacteria bacterium]|nr:Bcep22 5 [Alphaproteobacteria bacterium]
MANNSFLDSPFEDITDEITKSGLLPGQQATKPQTMPEVKATPAKAVTTPAPATAPVSSMPTRADIIKRAVELGLDPALPLSIFRAESSGNFKSKDSPKGAVGGFQVMPGTYKQMMGTEDGMRDPWKNMEAGLRYLAHGRKMLGTDDPALLAAGYHAGYGREELKRGQIPNTHDGLSSTADYARKVAGGAGGKVRSDSGAAVEGRFEPMSEEEVLAYQKTGKVDESRYVEMSEEEVAALSGAAPAGDGNLLTDIGKNFKAGLNSTAANVRELVSRIPGVGESIVEGADAVDRYFHPEVKNSEELLRRDTQQMVKGMTPEMQAAIDKKWWDSDKGSFGSAWSDPRSYLGGVVQSLPEQALSMLPAMRLAKAAYGAKIAAGAGTAAASQAAARTATVAGAISEGSLGGAGSAREVRLAVQELPQEVLNTSEAYQSLIASGMNPTEARAALAGDLSTRAFVTSGVVTGMFGGMGDRTIAKLFTEQVGQATIKNAAKGFAKGSLAEGVFEELPQSAAQKLAQNEALQQANPKQELTEDVANQALGGMVQGGLQGGAIGSVAASVARPAAQPAPAEPAPAPAEPPRVEPTLEEVPAPQPEPAPAEPTPPAPVEQPTPATESVPASPAPSGPLSGAVEQAADQTPEARVIVTAPEGQVAGTVIAVTPEEDGTTTTEIVDDDGQVYAFNDKDGVTIEPVDVPAPPAGPLTAAVEEAAERHAENPAPPPPAPPAKPAEPDYNTMELPQLRERLQYIAGQAKASGGWNKMFLTARKEVEAAIRQKTADAKAESKPSVEPLTTGPFDDRAQANKMMLRHAEETGQPHEVVEAKGKFTIQPIEEKSDGRSDTADAGVRDVVLAGAEDPAPQRAGEPAGRQADQEPVGNGPAVPAEAAPSAGIDVPAADRAADAQPALTSLEAARQKHAKQDEAVRQAAESIAKRKGTKAAPTGNPMLDSPASWIIREKGTGKVIAETFDQRKVDALNTAKYEAVPAAQHLGELNDPESAAGKAARAEAPAPKPKQEPRRKKAKPAEREKARADYFTPGNVVKSYRGHDRVLAYEPREDGGFSVKVQAVIKKGDEWVPAEGVDGRERVHQTEPGERDLKTGPVQRATKKEEAQPAPAEEAPAKKPRKPRAKAEPKYSVDADGIRQVMADKQGETTITREGVGDITITYGDEKHGLAHIARRRGAGFMDRLPELLRDGKVYEKPGQVGRIFIGNERDEAVIRLDRDGKDEKWLLSAYEKHPDLVPATASAKDAAASVAAPFTPMTPEQVKKVITVGPVGSVIARMIESGIIQIHKSAKTLPKEAGKVPRGVQAITMPDGSIHFVSGSLNKDNARAVLLHEMFHKGAENLIGSKQWADLMGRMGSLYRQSEESSGKAREFYDRARARVAAAKGKGAVTTKMEVEEFAAYAIEEYETNRDSLPAVIRKWVEDVIGVVKAYMVARYGKQIGEVTPAQLAGFAKLAIMDVAAAKRGEMFGPIGELFSVNDNRTVEVDGARRPIVDSNGDLVAPDFAGQVEFWRNYKGPVDDKGRPIVEKPRYSIADDEGPAPNAQHIDRTPLSMAVEGGLARLKKDGILPSTPMNYLADFARPGMTAVKDYMRVKRAMDTYRNEKHSQYDEHAQRWLKFNATAGKEAKALADLMHESTIAQVDPTKPYEPDVSKEEQTILKRQPKSEAAARVREKLEAEPARKEAHERLSKVYEALSDDAKDIYTSTRDQYMGQAKELDSIILANVEKTMEASRARARERFDARVAKAKRSLSGKELDTELKVAQAEYAKSTGLAKYRDRARITALRQVFESNRLAGPYFPLARFGDYFVSVRDDKGEIVSFSKFEGLKDARQFEQDLRKQHPNYEITTGLAGNRDQVRGAVDPRFLADIEGILAESGVPEDVQDEVWQRYLTSMPDLSMRKRFIHRKGTAGYSGDALRAYASTMFHGAHQMARLKFGQQMEGVLDEMREQAKQADKPIDATMLVNEFEHRHQWVMNPKGGALAQNMSSIAFTWNLALTPAAAIINTSQTFMMGVPVLGSRFGSLARATKELGKASLQLVTSKKWSIENNPRLTANEQEALRDFYQLGLIDRTQAH